MGKKEDDGNYTDLSILIPCRIDSPERRENTSCIIRFLINAGVKNISILESGIKQEYFPDTDLHFINSQFIEDQDAAFLKTKLNYSLHWNIRNGMEDEALRLLGDWYNTEPWSRSRFSDELCIPETDENPEALAAQNLGLYKLCEVAGTPTFFINGRRLPSQYEIDDIRYFEVRSRESEVRSMK